MTAIRARVLVMRLHAAVLPPLFALTLGSQLAQADIYTWVDRSGMINVSNLAPPDGARVTSVAKESVPKGAARQDATDVAHEAQLQALTERVRRLEYELALARAQVQPPVQYPAMQAPSVTYVLGAAPPTVQYAVASPPPPASAGCDPGWSGCWPWLWGPTFYPASVVVARTPKFGHFHSFRHLPPVAGRPPPHPRGNFPRR